MWTFGLWGGYPPPAVPVAVDLPSPSTADPATN